MNQPTNKKMAAKSDYLIDANSGMRDHHYRLLAERSLDIVIAHDLDRTFIYANPAWVTTTGYTIEETVGRPASDFVSPEYLDEGKARNLRRKAGDQSTYTYELEVIAKTGEKIPLEIHSSPIISKDGEFLEILLVARDLREQKKTQAALLESETRYRGLFESAPIAIWEEDFSEVKNLITDLQQEGVSDFATYFRSNQDTLLTCMQLVKIIDVNEMAVTMHRAKDKEELFTIGLERILTKEAMAVFSQALVSLINGETLFRSEAFAKRIDGEEFFQHVQWKILHGSEDSWQRIIISTQDLTNLKQAEEKLKLQLNDLNVLQATAFTCSQANDIDTLIRQVSNIIGNTLYPDIYGILLLDPKNKVLIPHPSYAFSNQTRDMEAVPLTYGITGSVAATQKAIRVDDTRKNDIYVVSSPSIKSELCVPIKVTDRVFGVINVESVKLAYFSQSDERLLNIIASQVATAIQKLESLSTEQKRRQFAETLQRIAAALTTTLNSEKAIDLILSELSSVVEFSSASVQLLRGNHLEIVGGSGELVLETEKDRTFAYPGNNPNTIVLQNMRPLILPDAQAFYPDFKDMPAIRSWLGVPLITNDRCIGLLTLDSKELDHFTEEEAQLVTSFAHHAALSLENAQLFEAERNRRKEAETLRETALAITSSLNLDHAIQLILEQLARVLPYDSASVQLLKDNTIINLGGRGWSDQEEVMKMCLPIPGDNPNTTVIEERRVVILKDAQLEHAPFSQHPHNYINSWMGVPLIFRDQVIGMLAVDSKQTNYFNEESALIAQTFAYQAAIAIENARLFNAERKRLEEAETLRQAAITINSALSLDVVLETVAKQMITVINSTGCAISAWDKEHNTLYTLVDYSQQYPAYTDEAGTQYDLAKYPITRAVLEENKTTIIQRGDDHIDSAETELMREQEFAMVLMLPMIAGNKTIGLIELYEEQESKRDRYSEDEINLIRGLGSHAALAVENARLYNAEQTRRQEAETLRQAAHTISSSLDLDEVLNTILASIKRVVPFHSAAVLLRINDFVEITSGYNLPHMEEQIGKRFPAGDALFDELLRTGYPLILPDAQKNPHFNNWAETSYIHGWMGIPLIVRGNIIGYITLDSCDVDAYQEKHAELAQIFAHQAASAIENARLYQNALRTAERRAVLHQGSQNISRVIQSSEETYKAIYNAAKELMPCDAFVISLRGNYENEQDIGVYLIDDGIQYPVKATPRSNSIITLAEQNGGSFIKQDITTNQLDGYSHFGSAKKTRSMLVSPMYVGEKLTGALSAQSYQANAYSEEEQILLEMLASQAAASIENARLFKETELRGKEFAELYTISQDMSADQDIQILLKRMLEKAANLAGVSSSGIYIFDEKNKELVASNFYGLAEKEQEKITGIRLKLGMGLAGKVAESLTPLHVDDYQSWENQCVKYKNLVPFDGISAGVQWSTAGGLIAL